MFVAPIVDVILLIYINVCVVNIYYRCATYCTYCAVLDFLVNLYYGFLGELREKALNPDSSPGNGGVQLLCQINPSLKAFGWMCAAKV